MGLPKSPPPEIPGFTFAQSIGAGGFADVFLYSQHSTGRGVAVKVLRSEHLSEQSLRQFETEANVMAGVSAHPFIVTIHDAGVAPDGRPYLVMEHYPQPHFGQRAAGGKLPLAEVLKVGVQISSAVETAHRADILHRDIKPANILTSAFGDPGLTDFGIAGVQTDDGLSTSTGVSMGFTSPEVVFDEAATGSRQSDVYALGATLYALLTGRSPIYVPGGDNNHGALAIRLERSQILPTHREDIPRSLELLLQSSLSYRADQRPDTAENFARALQDIEQQLQLAPTNLVLIDSRTPLGTRRSVDEEDGTRRRPRVIDVDGGEPVSAAITASAISARPPTTGTESLLSTGRTVRRGPVAAGPAHAGHETVARMRRAGPVENVPGGSPEPSDRRFATTPIALGAAALVVVAVIALVLTSGGGDSRDADESAPSTRPSTVPDAIGPASIDPPGRPSVTIEADGRVTLRWTPPPDLRDNEAATYRVFTEADGQLTPQVETSSLRTTLPAAVLEEDPGPDGSICFVVQARVLDTVSDADVCHRTVAEAPSPP